MIIGTQMTNGGHKKRENESIMTGIFWRAEQRSCGFNVSIFKTKLPYSLSFKQNQQHPLALENTHLYNIVSADRNIKRWNDSSSSRWSWWRNWFCQGGSTNTHCYPCFRMHRQTCLISTNHPFQQPQITQNVTRHNITTTSITSTIKTTMVLIP